MNSNDCTTPPTTAPTTRRPPEAPAGDGPRRPPASAAAPPTGDGEERRRPTVHPAVLAAAVALLAAVPEAQRVPFWRLCAAAFDRLHWYARLAVKLSATTTRPTDATVEPAYRGAKLVFSAITSEAEARGIGPMLDGLLAVLYGATPEAVAARIEQPATRDRAATVCAVWARIALDTGLEVEQTDAAEVETDEQPFMDDPRFALALAAVRALRPVDRDGFLEAFDTYLAAMSFACGIFADETDAARITASALASTAADVLVGAHDGVNATLPNEGDTWETADALAAALLHQTVKGCALRLDAETARIIAHDIDDARAIIERVKVTLDATAVTTAEPRARRASEITMDELHRVVTEAHRDAPEFSRELLTDSALYAVTGIEGPVYFTARAVLDLAAVRVRHAPTGTYGDLAVARANALAAATGAR